jgi:D-aminopeptidase
MRYSRLLPILALCSALPVLAADPAPRARDLGVPFDGTPGPLNAITDVASVTVGHETLVRDLDEGRAVRTGVTAILPRGHDSINANVYAGWFALNGNGEMTGTTWLEESGFLEGPVMITNTHSIGAVHEGVIRWLVDHGTADHTGYYWSLPVVAETWDGWLNDINGFHVRPEHAGKALDAAKSGPVTEGAVGGGTGMICFEFKCGIGTASRIVAIDEAKHMLGVLVQANFGVRAELTVAGVPVGKEIPGSVYTQVESSDRGPVAASSRSNVAESDRVPVAARSNVERSSRLQVSASSRSNMLSKSSIIVVVATDAPLLPHQLERIARRVSLGIARTGGTAHNGSGDIFIAFSTANTEAARGEADAAIGSVPNDSMDALFVATVQAAEEAIINALVAGREMTGQDGHVVPGVDHEQLRGILRRYVRLEGE